jgi:cupin 2 domain-containing protein
MVNQNLYTGLPTAPETDERFDALLTKPGLRIERIVSTGQASPPGFWCDPEEAEWVVLLQGAAGLRFVDEDEVRELKPGDWLYVVPHRRHRVEWTEPQTATVWLALHFDET